MEVRQVQQDLQDTKRGTTVDFNCVPLSLWEAGQSREKNLSLSLLKTPKICDKPSNFEGL